jgi:hypothetical protein
MGHKMPNKMVVSKESLRNAEKAVADLNDRIAIAVLTDRPALQDKLDRALRYLEILRRGTLSDK